MSSKSARESLREQQAKEAAQARHRKLIALIALVLAIILAVIVAFWAVGRNKRSNDAGQTATGDALAQALTSIPVSTFEQVGAPAGAGSLKQIPGAKPSDKPRVVYIGAGFCPFCAVERLALTAALSRFGAFAGLHDALSSPNEGQISNIPTVDYHNASFTSNYLSFTGVETADRFEKPLQQPSAEDQAIFTKYVPGGSIPFVYYGTAFSVGATYDGTEFAGVTSDDLAAKLRDPNSAETKKVVGAANVLTAQICRETGQQPAQVCSSAAVTAASKSLQ